MGLTLAQNPDETDRGEALAWAAPTGPLPAPPIDTRAHVLPLGELLWPDAERLFLRLLTTVRPVQYAKLFGVPGQNQAGIDAYARLPLHISDDTTDGRNYITLQSRRVHSLTPAAIEDAVDDFLDGQWADRSAVFYYATTFDLQNTRFDTMIRTQVERLAERKIALVPWDLQEVSAMLKLQPRLVDEFFGRAWVERFCGAQAADELANNLQNHDIRELRAELRTLYEAVFYAQGGVNPAADDNQQFVVLDVKPLRHAPVQFGIGRVDEAADEQQQTAPDPMTSDGLIAARRGARRRSFRSARHLLTGIGGAMLTASDGVRADAWLTGGRFRLLVGRPGAGKSSILRFVATDLLSADPQSVPLQQEHASDLPIWLPFGFLCRHLGDSTENSLVSAAEAWLMSQSAGHLWPLVQRALHDDRLLLLVDGIDEWSDVGAAEHALGIMEAFLWRTRASAVLSTRPYAVDRLNWRLPWVRGEISPLTDDQRRTIAADVLRPVVPPPNGVNARPPGEPMWGAGVESFLDQLVASPELAELSRTPLILTLLATTWQGEPLPRQRFKIYARLIELLIEKHPQMRRRASHAGGGPLAATEVTTLFAAVAYRLRVQEPAGTVTKSQMRRLVVESMIDDEVLGYEPHAARRVADAVLAMAEDEFGLIVSYGAGTVGFLHRVVLDQMAGQYLTTLSPAAQTELIGRAVHEPAWRDVLLTLLASQVNPHATEALLAAALESGDGPWADLDGHELLAAALATGVTLTPRSHTAHLRRLVERVETHPSLIHRVKLVAALVATLATPPARRLLVPVMKRWLTAVRPHPAPTMWALRDLDVPDEVALEHLRWGIRHPDDYVKVNAALAIARRFDGQPPITAELAKFADTGPTSATQAAAVLALGYGWARDPITLRLIDWSCRQPSLPLQIVGLHLTHRRTVVNAAADTAPGGGPGKASFRPQDRAWLLSLLQQEGHTGGPWPTADLVDLAVRDNAEAADFALQTLMTNGRTGGDRSLAWYVTCHAFAGDDRFKHWVAGQLGDPEQRGLLLYNLAMIPKEWRDDPVFAQALRPYVEAELLGVSPYEVADLATALPPDEARRLLLAGLDVWRPYAAARTLVDNYIDDDHVRATLVDRLRGTYSQAAPLAGVALDVLGWGEGFTILVSLLHHDDDDASRQEQVVVAQAVAEAWTLLSNTVQEPGFEGESARDVLASFDPAELAQRCTGVDPRSFAWHVPAIITAWPEQPAVQAFADSLLLDTQPITSGIPDVIPEAILKAYCGRTDEPSQKIVTKTLDLLRHLEPELREVLAFELARSSLPAADLVDIMQGWIDDPDNEVRRTCLIGLTQSISRHHQARQNVAGTHAGTTEMHWLRKEVRNNLCAYGPNLEELRQLAWISMLMLGDLTLSDGVVETIGSPGQLPGVGLDSYDNDVDPILVDLVAANWEKLQDHFGESLFHRLTGNYHRRSTPDGQRRHVMAALATVASRYPAIAEIVRIEAGRDSELRRDRRFLLWAKEENRGNEEVLEALAAHLTVAMYQGREDVRASILDRDSWNVPDEVFNAVLVGHAPSTGSNEPVPGAGLGIYAQLFPQHADSRAALRGLEQWFSTDRDSRQPRELAEVLSLALGAVEPQDLPAVAVRAHARLRMSLHEMDLPLFTGPLLRRLHVDIDAVEEFRRALTAPMDICEDSPVLMPMSDALTAAPADLELLQRGYLFATALRHTGALTPQDEDTVRSTLATASPDTVVHNPFTGYEGPLRLAVLDLTVSSG